MQQILKLPVRLWCVNRWLVMAIILTGATWLAGDADFRAAPVAGSMNLPAFPGKPELWSVTGPVENISFTHDSIELAWQRPTPVLAMRTLPISPSADGADLLVRISGRIERLSDTALERVVKDQTRFLVIYRRAGKLLQYGAVTRLNGQYAHQRFEYLVQPPAGSDAIELHWNLRSPGHWRLNGLDVTAVTVNRGYQYVAVALGLCWLVYLAGMSAVILRGTSRALTVGMLGCVCVIVVGTGMGQPMMTSLVQPVVALFWSWYPGEHLPDVQTLLKTGHVLAFMLLTGLLLRVRHLLALSVPGSVALCVTLAAASESLQRHRFNRSPELRDVVIDSLGIALALLCFALWCGYRSWRGQASRAKSAVPAAKVSSGS